MTKRLANDYELYLTNKLSSLTHLNSNNAYWRTYNIKRIKRFLLSTGIAFFLQYLTLIHLTVTYPALPMYPPMGSAFVILYLLGKAPLFGLFLGGFCAYLFKGLAMPSLLLYLTADLGCSYLGVKLCKSVFSSDNLVYVDSKEWRNFVIINACASCFLSSLLRLLAVVFYTTNTMSLETLGYNWLTLWLADLNAIIVFSGFFLTWMTVHLRRERIVRHPLSNCNKVGLLLFVISCAVLMKKIEFILFAVGISLYLANSCGVLIATASSYALTVTFLIYVMFHQQQYLNDWGIQRYVLISCTLLCFLLSIQYIGQRATKHSLSD